MNKPFQSATTPHEQSVGGDDVARDPRDLASYPERLFANDMAAIYRVSVNRIYQLDAEGAFLFAEIKPRIGRKAWSRERVRQHFAGEIHGLTLNKSPRKRSA